VYFYLQPEKIPTLVGGACTDAALTPRLFFEDATLWDTALKVKRLLGTDNQPYVDALGAVLAHELVRLNAGCQRIEALARGGLAAWQQRIVISYIEEHLAEQIPLATLAQLVRLKPVLLLSSIQAVPRRAAAPISQRSAHRACQGPARDSCALGDGYRIGAWLQRDKFVHGSFSQSYRDHPDQLSP
jgi:hypothetical protein